MALEDYLVPCSEGASICFDCKKACGLCSWTEVDPETNKIRFQPVPGSNSKIVTRRECYGPGRVVYAKSYKIIDCPLFDPDEPRESNNCELTDEQARLIFEKWRRLGELV